MLEALDLLKTQNAMLIFHFAFVFRMFIALTDGGLLRAGSRQER